MGAIIMMQFDCKKAEELLREVFLTEEILDELGVSRTEIEEVVCADAIEQIQKERMESFELVKNFKDNMMEMFPEYRFSARLKSLPSIFGKALRHRTLADVFGIKVVVPNKRKCYTFKKWLYEHYIVFDFEDRIKNPKFNGYKDLKIVISYQDILIEFIIQTPSMYVDSHTIQKHSVVYPWKYHRVIRNLPAEYEYIEF